MTGDIFRVYTDVGQDGYPPEWHSTIKHLVREHAGHRCVRCGHPYRTGQHPMEKVEDGAHGPVYVSWSPCDEQCTHGMPARDLAHPFGSLGPETTTGAVIREAREQGYTRTIEARARILTVHHLDGDKANCRWWNLAALCQRCHLTIQGRVVMARVWPWEHSEWFRPYVAGYYASVYLGEDLDREQTMARLGELLALERAA